MNQYENGTRGVFQTEYAKQLISYDGLKFKGRSGVLNVTPADIDGVVQLDRENCFMFFELKYSGTVPTGQSDALTRLADAVQKGGVNCAVFVAIHNTPFPETVMAKNAIVKKMYWNRKWYYESKGRTLYDIMLGFIDFIKEEH